MYGSCARAGFLKNRNIRRIRTKILKFSNAEKAKNRFFISKIVGRSNPLINASGIVFTNDQVELVSAFT